MAMIKRRKPASPGHSPASRDITRLSIGSFAPRVRLAIDLLRSDETDQRTFDNCFEMGDGIAVGLAISREAQHNPLLARRIEPYISFETDLPWSAFAPHFAHIHV